MCFYPKWCFVFANLIANMTDYVKIKNRKIKCELKMTKKGAIMMNIVLLYDWTQKKEGARCKQRYMVWQYYV